MDNACRWIIVISSVLFGSASDLANALQGEEAGELESLRLLQTKHRGLGGQGEALGRKPDIDCAEAEVMDLSGRELTAWPFNTSAWCPDLQRLDLSDNFLTDIPLDAFFSMPRLGVLRLSRNRLTTFPSVASLSSLWHLDLSSNMISTLPPGILFKSYSLVMLDLSRNKLLTLPSSDLWLAESNSLDSLSVASNHINSLGRRLFARLSNLDWLDLSSNQLSRLEPSILTGIGDLDNLLLVGNPFECRVRIGGRCLCATDCEPNATDASEDGVQVEVPSTWCQLPMCISIRTNASSSFNSSDDTGNPSGMPQGSAQAVPLNRRA
mmetsp:Transcript_34229/g.76852  ORF Transcript_34229/g.76852 Transcript_34229/m.76852 type:complete len:323 (-) Transcript_34229:40-1008(-)